MASDRVRVRWAAVLRGAVVAAMMCGMLSVGLGCKEEAGPGEAKSGGATVSPYELPTTVEMGPDAPKGFSVIRVVIPKGVYTEEELRNLSVEKANEAAELRRLIVYFFDDEGALDWKWEDGIRDFDKEHMLVRAVCVQSPQEVMELKEFKIADDPATGAPRTDVVKQ